MRSARLLVAPLVAMAVCCPLLRLPAQADPDARVTGGDAFPAGWHVRTDKNKPTADVKFVRMGRGLHVTLGPAVVLWRDADRVTGRYSVSATFTQTKNPRHAEGYGLIMGGRRLGDAKNRYTYFLVRGDGTFLVKRRVAGDSTVQVTKGWTPSDAVVKADSAGQATNELSIVVDGREVSFLANGKELYGAKAADLDTQGLVGYRVNHNLDVHLGALVVRKR
jgi:hypothetical protein